MFKRRLYFNHILSQWYVVRDSYNTPATDNRFATREEAQAELDRIGEWPSYSSDIGLFPDDPMSLPLPQNPRGD